MACLIVMRTATIDVECRQLAIAVESRVAGRLSTVLGVGAERAAVLRVRWSGGARAARVQRHDAALDDAALDDAAPLMFFDDVAAPLGPPLWFSLTRCTCFTRTRSTT